MGVKKRVGIIFGGKSAEHQVSLQSAKNIIDALDRERYEPVLIGIDQDGKWHVSDEDHFLMNADDPATIALAPSGQGVAMIPGAEKTALVSSSYRALTDVDVVFPIVHGTLGEDGSLQGMLRLANIPFVGSDVLGSAVSMDKDVAKRLLREAGLQVACGQAYTRAKRRSIDVDELVETFGLPLFVKPANQGSSVGVSKVMTKADLDKAIDDAFLYDHKVVVEAAVIGREIECAVLGNDEPRASICGEVLPRDGFYSYDAKYIDDDGAMLAIPANLAEGVEKRIQEVAIQAYGTLGCAGLARVDVFLTAENEIVVNEINTLPGFTKISMYPKLWEETGMSYQTLITTLVELAMERHAQNNSLQHSRV
ncbi:D-alanine--D-alanine ligase [Shouchella lonarensis]|uniref:D-alanine--D-alanine ligase n=1 Tax=Shouchella lonarensis TaxID=1464122 RepID=A0A1G6H322_9BACI|nr:D-alanine--D-alanine ligase [Shouchella lonarensis]SDB88543.1 D-alanine--D-alanine ligase [Shouchella lonarensis]